MKTSKIVGNYKERTGGLVVGALSVTTVVLWTTYFPGTSKWGLFAIGLGISSAIFNAVITKKEFTLRLFGRSISSRSDAIDLCRWGLNLLVIDPAILLLLRPDPVGHFCTWMWLIVGAIADTQDRKYRYAVAVFGMVSFVGTFWTLHGSQYSPLQLCYFTTGLCAMIVVSQRTFSFWSDTLIELASAKQREIQSTIELNRIRTEAMIGNQSRAVAHEINNIMGVMTLALGNETPRSEKILTSAAERLRKLCSTLTKAGKQSSTKVTTSVATIVDEVRTLLVPFVTFQTAELAIIAEPHTNDNGVEFLFEESEGSTYLILHNLVKNAVEAGVGLDRRIQVKMEVTIGNKSPTDNFARIRVSDNGMGMTETEMSRYLRGDLESSKEFGHGLGGKFVRDKCLENGFQLHGESTVGVGTAIWFDVPRLKS